MFRRRKSLAFISCAVFILAGCGTKKYDETVKQRITYLKNPPTPTAPEWEPYSSENYSYTLEVPAKPEVDFQPDKTTESLTMELASATYLVQFEDGTRHPSLADAAKFYENYYSGEGMTMGEMTNSNVNGHDCVRMNFTSAEGASIALQVLYANIADRKKMCLMAVDGADATAEDKLRFFGSIAPQ